MYYFKNIHCYPDMIAFIEQEFVNYTNYIGESKKYKIDLDVKSIFVRDKLRDFLLKYDLALTGKEAVRSSHKIRPSAYCRKRCKYIALGVIYILPLPVPER